MANQKEPVKITLAVLRKQVEDGMKRKELSEYYGIPEVQMAKALKSAGLKIRKFHGPAFQLVDEEEPEITEGEPETLEGEDQPVPQLQMLIDISDEEGVYQAPPIGYGIEEEKEDPIFPPISHNPLNY